MDSEMTAGWAHPYAVGSEEQSNTVGLGAVLVECSWTLSVVSKCAWVGAKTSLFVIPCATGCRQRSKECVGAVYGCLCAVLGGVVVVDDGEEEEEGVGRGEKELGGDDQESKVGFWWRYERLSTLNLFLSPSRQATAQFTALQHARIAGNAWPS